MASEPAPDRAAIEGVILAGGRGLRMGGLDKGWVPLAGRSLVEHVIERLQPQVARITISANRNLDRYRSLGHTVVEDDTATFGTFSGPLVGMLAGLTAACLPWVMFAPCDTPALPTDLVARLARASGGTHAAVACCAGHRHPVICLVPANLAPQMLRMLAQGERRPVRFLENVAAVDLEFDDPAAFLNVNAPASPAPQA